MLTFGDLWQFRQFWQFTVKLTQAKDLIPIAAGASMRVESWPMATSVAAPAARKGFFGVAFRIILWILLLVIIAGTLAFLWFYNGARSALPQLDGSISVAGLQTPVFVVRDTHGVPHITAANLQDLFFAQGYVAAQDPLRQMDLTRRAVGGEMAEIFPASTAPPQPVSRATAAVRPRQTWVDYDK